MSRRILPLPADHIRNESTATAVAPRQDSLKVNLGILRAENLLKQKGWRVMAPQVHAAILICSLYSVLTNASR